MPIILIGIFAMKNTFNKRDITSKTTRVRLDFAPKHRNGDGVVPIGNSLGLADKMSAIPGPQASRLLFYNQKSPACISCNHTYPGCH